MPFVTRLGWLGQHAICAHHYLCNLFYLLLRKDLRLNWEDDTGNTHLGRFLCPKRFISPEG